MSDKAELIELCKIAKHFGGPQNLSAVGIGRYLRLCSPEVVMALFDEIEVLRKALGACAGSLEGEMLQKYHGQQSEDMYPVTRRDYDRDMAEIEGYKNIVSISAE